MAHPAPLTDTNFRLTFLLSRLQEALYEDLPVFKFEVYHHFSGLSFIAEVNFLCQPKIAVSCNKFINIIIIIINFFRSVFSEYTEAMATSLIPLDIILPEICAFIFGFSYTVWTKMTSLACSLTDGVLADAILISPRPLLPPTI